MTALMGNRVLSGSGAPWRVGRGSPATTTVSVRGLH